jgi:hypothetical protein
VPVRVNERGDLSRHRPRQIRVPKLVHVFQFASLRSAAFQLVSISACQVFWPDLSDGYAAVGQQYLSWPHGGDEFHGYLCLVSGGVFAEGVVALDRDDPHWDAGIGADDASVVVEGAVAQQR